MGLESSFWYTTTCAKERAGVQLSCVHIRGTGRLWEGRRLWKARRLWRAAVIAQWKARRCTFGCSGSNLREDIMFMSM